MNSTRNEIDEPAYNPDRELDQIHGQIGQPRKANAAWAQATQHRPAHRSKVPKFRFQKIKNKD